MGKLKTQTIYDAIKLSASSCGVKVLAHQYLSSQNILELAFVSLFLTL